MAFLTNYTTNAQKVIKILAYAFKSASTNDLVTIGTDALNGGATVAQIYQALFDSPVVQGQGFSAYGQTATSFTFLTALVGNLTAGTSISAATKATYVTNLTPFLSQYATRGEFVDVLMGALEGLTTTDTDLIAIQNVMANRAEMGAFYAQSQAGGTFIDMNQIMAAVSAITDDAASVTAAIAGTTTGSTFTLTTGVDTIPGTSGNDTITGVFGGATGDTFTVADTIDGGAGIGDILALTAQGILPSPAAVTVKNVEIITVRDVVGAEVNALLIENSPAISFTDTLALQTSKVTNASTASTFGLAGKGNLTVDFAAATTALAKVALTSVGTSASVRSTVNVADGNTVAAVTIAATGTNFVNLLAGTAAATVTLTGAGTNNILVSTIAGTSTIDASTSSGTNTINVGTGLSHGDVIKGGTGADTVTFNATVALGSVTLTGVETLTGDIDTDVTLNLTNSTGIKTFNSNGSSANLTLTNASADLATVNLNTQLQLDNTTNDTDNTFSLAYKAGQTGALAVNIGSTATIPVAIDMGALTFTNISSLALNTVGTVNDNDIGLVTINGSSNVALSSTVGAGGDLAIGGIDVDGNITSLNITVGAAGDLLMSDTNATGSVGDINMTVGSGGSGYVDWVSADEGNVGNVTMTVASGGSGAMYASANSGSVGDVTLTAGANTSAYISVSGSGFSAGTGDDYLGGGNIGNITVNAIGTDASASAFAYSEINDASGNTGQGGNIGNLIANVNGDGASAYIEVSGGSGGSVGNVTITVAGSGYAYVSAYSDENLSAGGNIGNLAVTIGDDGYVEVDLYASGSVGTTNLTAGNDASGYISVNGYSGDVGAATVTIGNDSFFSGYFLTDDGSMGSVTVTAGTGATVLIDASGGTSMGAISVTAGVDSYVYAEGRAYNGNVGAISVTAGAGSDVDVESSAGVDNAGAITITGGAAADNASAYASGGSIDAINLAGWLGTYEIGATGVTQGTVLTGGQAGGTIFATAGADVITGGAGADTLWGYSGGDVIVGGAGVDTIYGGGGADDITAGLGADIITGGAGDDTIRLAEGTAAVDTVVFSAEAGNGTDTITGFIVANDLLNVELLGAGNVAGETAIAAGATSTALTTAYVGVFANGANGTGGVAITTYTNLTQVATFLAASLTETAAEAYTLVINDLLTNTAYVYNIDTASATIVAGDIVLVGSVSANAALTVANTGFTA